MLIVGAGISGIGAAYRIHEKNPGLSYTVLNRGASAAPGTCSAIRHPLRRRHLHAELPTSPDQAESVADSGDIRAY
jgi:cation diffusion facilitator CzcD-associated flavoprotein CzcO